MTTKTAQAIALVDAGAGPVAAAAQAGISYTVLYRALKRRADKPICPCCKQVVRKGFEAVVPAAAAPAAVPEPVEDMTINAAYRAIDKHLRTVGLAAKKNVAQSLRNLLALAGER